MRVDEILAHPDPYHMKIEEKNDLKFRAIKESFLHHYENCARYREYSESKKITPEEIKNFDDLSKIPLLPINIFKKYDLLSVKKEDIHIVAKSSGTTGNISKVFKDKLTVERLFKGVFKMMDWMVKKRGGFVGALNPPPEENDAWMVQTVSLIFPQYFDKMEYFIKQGKIDIEYMIKRLLNPATPKPRHLFGPPFAYLKVIEGLKKTGINIELDNDSFAVTGGGWKMFADKSIPKGIFREMLSKEFSIPTENIRDSYSCTEINSWIVDCKHFKKHIPPWLHVSIRNPENPDEEMEEGEEGLIAFLDPLAHSYPAFILTDDIGKIVVGENEVCECGSIGPCLHEDIRRAKGAEARGCALKLQKLVNGIK
ncbi:MAG TPA: hypothetical protein ENL42_03850 [Thermoplasmatales archaeon]|nr:hypothetical protein [Thermoplasmatales archaeon]